MKPSPRVMATLALVVFGFPAFLIVGMVAGALDMFWLLGAFWFALLAAWALTGVLPERWPEDGNDADSDQQARKPNDD